MSKRKSLKRIVWITLVLLVLIAVITTHIISTWYFINAGKYYQDARRVFRLPNEWYISIQNLEEATNGNITFRTWRGNMRFFDADNKEIFYIPLNDRSIVRYRGEYFIRDVTYDGIVYQANLVAEQRNRIHRFGEPILLRSNYYFQLQAVVVVNSVKTESIDYGELSTINFIINPPITDWDRIGIFGYIETNNGTIIDEFTFIDGETVQVKLPPGENINMIALRHPRRSSWADLDDDRMTFFSRFVRRVSVCND